MFVLYFCNNYRVLQRWLTCDSQAHLVTLIKTIHYTLFYSGKIQFLLFSMNYGCLATRNFGV